MQPRGARLAVGVEAVRHELVAVELGGGLGELAALADLSGHGALLQGCHALPPVDGVRRKAGLAIVVQAVLVGLVAVEVLRLLVHVAPPALLAGHRWLLCKQHHAPQRAYLHLFRPRYPRSVIPQPVSDPGRAQEKTVTPVTSMEVQSTF